MRRGVSRISIEAHTSRGYCSQADRELISTVNTIEEGVQIIEKILAKDILCKHDVEDINAVYETIDHLENQVDKIPERNIGQIFNSIINQAKPDVSSGQRLGQSPDDVWALIRAKPESKPKSLPACAAKRLMTKTHTQNAKAWICFYHLQSFANLGAEVKKNFVLLSRDSKKTREELILIAVHLPCCISKNQFDQDVNALIGNNLASNSTRCAEAVLAQSVKSDIIKILNHKREKIDNYESLISGIANKKKEVGVLRKSDSQKYPPYLDELFDYGYIDLVAHLLHMKTLSNRNDRGAANENISFSLLSYIVLQVRDTIIQKVVTSIPIIRKNILFLLGGSGAGKSTTLCFLRGDKMVLKGDQYESQNDPNNIIMAGGAISSTFLPNVEILDNGLVIVDFPGFDCSDGQLISLGMEFALKSLIVQYHPKILVAESITNIEGRYINATNLGTRLSRILENKEKCILGITKYSKDPNFVQIQTIEKQQKLDFLKPSSKEIEFETQIEVLSDLNIPALQQKTENLQQQLSQMQQLRTKNRTLVLPDKAQKTECRTKLQEIENELLKNIGLVKIMQFYNLEDPVYLPSYLNQLLDPTDEIISVNARPLLDPKDEKLLEHCFKNNLKRVLENLKYFYVKFENFKDFKKSVSQTSLINTILSQKNPEVGQFLHAPEMDPRLVRSYDKEVVSSCIKNYIETIISDLNIVLINKILSEMEKTADFVKIEKLGEIVVKLRNYIMGLLGSMPKNPAKAERIWIYIRVHHSNKTTMTSDQSSDHGGKVDAFGKSYKLPT
jgi:hypothetical protein